MKFLTDSEQEMATKPIQMFATILNKITVYYTVQKRSEKTFFFNRLLFKVFEDEVHVSNVNQVHAP